jgi:type IV pilus assembly protein PilC
MKQFTYKVKNQEGKELNGMIETVGENEALKALRRRDYYVISLKEKSEFDLFSNLDFLQGISTRDIAVFTRQLGTMIKTGLTLTDSLIILKQQSEGKFADILEEIVEEIQGGSSFYEALRPYRDIFSNTYLSLIKSGESSGQLDDVLVRLADNLEKQEEFKGKVKSALIYPAIVILGMIVVGFIMMIFVIPKLTTMYKDFGVELPTPTKILIGVSTFVSNFWYVVLLLVAGLVIGFIQWHKTDQGKEAVDRFLINLPIVGPVVKKSILTQVCQTLAMLVDAGVPIIQALEIVAQTSNNYIFEKSIKTVAKRVEKGVPLAKTFGEYEMYPPLFIQMVSVGEETGKLGEVLEKVSHHFEMETETAVKGLTSAMEPLMMVVLGVGVGFLVISIITPIYNLTSQF